MTKYLLALSLAASVLTITGCAPANISMDLREPSSSDPSMQTRCVDFTTGDARKVNSILAKFDGWKVLYASEYTTGNKTTTSMVMCFERPYTG